MTNQEGTPPQIYVPTLRKELVARPLPAGVLFLDPGLPHAPQISPAEETGPAFTPANYPFSREEAERVLAELLSLGETLDLANPKNASVTRESLPQTAFANDEARDIARFAGRGDESSAPPSPLIAAHKVVLLAWDLETRLGEIHALRQEVAAYANPLAEALGSPPDEDIFPELTENAEPDWRLTLSAMAAFLPEDGVWVTAHPGMRESALERGMLLPLPEDAAEKLTEWPESVKSALLWTKVPLWRLLGHAKEPENAPWLAKSPEILFVRGGV
ncbi:MAG: hypothetical protein DELT_02820 [Desulfovibrio sp.]